MLIPFKSDINLQLSINADGPPKRGAFEVAIALQPSDDIEQRNLIWTGLKRTPRAQKFPNAEEITKVISEYLKLTLAEGHHVEQDEEGTQESVKEEIGSDGEKQMEKVAKPSSKQNKRGRSKK